LFNNLIFNRKQPRDRALPLHGVKTEIDAQTYAEQQE